MENQVSLREEYNPEGSELRRLQLRMLDMLIVVDEICQRHNIPYWIEGGTLLGAVRHGGFIPWDDDLDIALMKNDYIKLLKYLKEELPERYKLQTHETDRNYYLMFAKIRELDSEIKEVGEYDELYAYKGIYIDIFSMEPVYPFFSKVSSYLNYLVRKFASGRRRYFGKVIAVIMLFWLFKCGNGLFRLLGWLKKPSTIGYSYGVYSPLQCSEDMLFPLSEIDFENHRFKAPAQVDAYLRSVFGDYMELPAKEMRGKHIVQVEF